MEINVKLIGNFVKNLNDSELIYLNYVVSAGASIRSTTTALKMTKKDVCERFKINPRKYKEFMAGGYNYSVEEMAILNCLFIDVKMKEAEENVPFKVAK